MTSPRMVLRSASSWPLSNVCWPVVDDVAIASNLLYLRRFGRNTPLDARLYRLRACCTFCVVWLERATSHLIHETGRTDTLWLEQPQGAYTIALGYPPDSLARVALAATFCPTMRVERATSTPEANPRISASAITRSATGSDGLLVIRKTMPSSSAIAVCGVVRKTGSWVRARSSGGSGPSGASRASWA